MRNDPLCSSLHGKGCGEPSSGKFKSTSWRCGFLFHGAPHRALCDYGLLLFVGKVRNDLPDSYSPKPSSGTRKTGTASRLPGLTNLPARASYRRAAGTACKITGRNTIILTKNEGTIRLTYHGPSPLGVLCVEAYSAMPTTKFDLSRPMFHDDVVAREHLGGTLWPNGPYCPRCGVTGDRITKLQGKSTRPGVYKCKDCRKPFTVTVGTVMDRSHIALHKWVLAAHLISASKKGMSALQLHRMMGISYEGAWFLFHRLRTAAGDPFPAPIGGKGKVVEADETYIGGKEGSKHASKRKGVGGGPKGKMAVFSLVERDGETRSFHVANVTAQSLRPIIVTHAFRSSYLMTDEAAVYPSIGDEFAGHMHRQSLRRGVRRRPAVFIIPTRLKAISRY